jgi:hypothetical protein
VPSTWIDLTPAWAKATPANIKDAIQIAIFEILGIQEIQAAWLVVMLSGGNITNSKPI